MLALSAADVARFWSKVDRSGAPDACWPWMASRNHDGYGEFRLNGRNIRAHRVAFVLTGGVLTADEPQVLHRCDTPSCCRPGHLFRGTPAANAIDRDAKGRHGWRTHPGRVARGERHGQAKLTDVQACEIRLRVAAGETQTAIAREFMVAPTTIGRIVRIESYRLTGVD